MAHITWWTSPGPLREFRTGSDERAGPGNEANPSPHTAITMINWYIIFISWTIDYYHNIPPTFALLWHVFVAKATIRGWFTIKWQTAEWQKRDTVTFFLALSHGREKRKSSLPLWNVKFTSSCLLDHTSPSQRLSKLREAHLFMHAYTC